MDKRIERTQNVIRLDGPPYSGKMAMARKIVDVLHSASCLKRHIAAAFFFCNDDNTRNSLRTLIPTIAYQLATWNPVVGEKIKQVLESDPAILTAKSEWQWRVLVVEPLKAVDPQVLDAVVIIIDSLCQCENHMNPRQLISSCGLNFPLAFLINSTPQPHIEAAFGGVKLSAICRERIQLEDTFSACNVGIAPLLITRKCVLCGEQESGRIECAPLDSTAESNKQKVEAKLEVKGRLISQDFSHLISFFLRNSNTGYDVAHVPHSLLDH